MPAYGPFFVQDETDVSGLKPGPPGYVDTVAIGLEGAVPGANAHVAGFFERDVDLIDAVGQFLVGGLQAGGVAITVATPAHDLAIAEVFAGHEADLDALTAAGRWHRLDASTLLNALMVDGRPDAAAFEHHVGSLVDQASAVATPVVAFGEMVDLLWSDGDLDGAIELEALWNDLGERRAFSLYCAYQMSGIEASADLVAAKAVCDHHTAVVPLLPLGTYSHDVDADEVAKVFVPAPAALPSVRDFLSRALDAWGYGDRVADASIVCSELTANAIEHAESPFRVTLSHTPTTIRIAVRDVSATGPALLPPDPTRIGGCGVALIAALSRAWGTEFDAHGKTVWAELDTAA